MTHRIVSVLCGGSGFMAPGEHICIPFDNRDNTLSPCQAYQCILDECDKDVLIMAHDDVEIHDIDWLSRLLNLFKLKPQCVAAGFGGATSLGNKDLYRKPYDIRNMARGNYASNQDDAEVHGERFAGTRQVAVLDAFLMAVSVNWLKQRGGWPVEHLTHHALDLWLACEAARCGKEIWLTGVSCLHRGGGSSIGEKYAKASWLQGGSTQSDHATPHLYLWDNYRDVLPITIGV